MSGKVLKHKRHHSPRRFPKTGRKVKPMTEPTKIFLGALDVTEGEALALDIPAGASVEEIQAAILKANAQKQAAAQRESEALAKMFLDRAAIERGDK